MAIEDLSEQTFLITLPREPHLGSDLEIAARLTASKSSRDVIVDFARVQIMPSATICSLIVLQQLLAANGRRMVLCSVPPAIACVFLRVGLQNVFRFVEDRHAALQAIGQEACL